MFDKANVILESRALSQEGKAKHSNRYAFSGKIKCACCSSTYVARYKNRKDGNQYKAWRCFQAARHGSPRVNETGNQVGCLNESIRNEDAAYIMGVVVRSLDFDKDLMVRNILSVIESVLAADNAHIQTEMDYIKDALREMLNGTCLDDVFYRNILSRMVVHNRNRVDVYLSFLPHRWSCAIEKV